MMKKILLEDAFILNLIRLGRFWVRILPSWASLASARFIGSIFYWTGKRRHIAYKNLRMAFAQTKNPRELKRISMGSMQNLAMCVVDMLGIPDLTLEEVEKRFTIEGRENFEPFLREKKGVIFLTGHFGSWELPNVVSSLLGYPTTALARVQKHPRSDAYLNSLRRSTGGQVIHKGMPLREIMRALKEGKIVGIVSDQDGGKKGCFVDFFGRMSSTPAGAAVFSLRTGSPIVLSSIVREPGNRHRIEISKPLQFPPDGWDSDRAESFLLQQFAAGLEEKVRQYPEQWLWAHRRWKSSPDRRVLVLSDGKAGHLNQSRAVLEALKRERKAHEGRENRLFEQLIDVEFKSAAAQKLLRALSLAFGGHLPLRRFWMKLALKRACYERLLHTYADVVISCGSSLVDVNLWMKNENFAKSVVVMKPDFGPEHFDAVIAPKHDRLPGGPRVFVTEGALSSIRLEDLEIEAGTLAAELTLEAGKRRIGVLIGGDSGSLRFEPKAFEEFLSGIARAASLSGTQVLLTTSRRTPQWAETLVKERFADRDKCPFLLIANESNRPGAVPGILGLSDVLVVTAESMSMVSEALSASKPVVVVKPWAASRLKSKHEEYLSRVEKSGHIALCGAEGTAEAVRNALSADPSSVRDYRLSEDEILGEAARRVIA